MLRQTRSLWASKPSAKVPSGAAPTWPEMWSQRLPGPTSAAWL